MFNENKDETDFRTDIEMILPRRGEIRSGKVVKLDNDGVWVDVGFKTEGNIPKGELSEKSIKLLASGELLGQDVNILVLKVLGEETLLLSEKKALLQKSWDTVKGAYESQEDLKLPVLEETKGGLLVDIGGGLKGFVPASHLGLRYIKDRSKYVGKKLKVRILHFDQKKKSVVLSQRVVLEEEEKKRRDNLLKELKVGDIKWVKVNHINEDAVRVSLSGISGFISYDELSWGKVKKPVKFIKEGDVIKAYILEINPEQPELKLSLRLTQPNPWDQFLKLHPQDSIVDGKVVRVDSSGLFVRVGRLVGLVPYPEVSWRRNIRLQDTFKESDPVKVKVMNVDPEHHRVSLSVKRVKPDPWEILDNGYKIGDIVEGLVTKTYDFGGFVELEEGLEGLIPFSEITYKRIKNPNEVLEEGKGIKAKIININKDERRLTLSLKALEKDPWDDIEQLYPFNSYVRGVVVKIASFGVFVELSNGIEGLIPLSHLSEKRITNPSEVIQEGQEIVAKVIYISKERHKVTLSMRLINIESEYNDIKKFFEDQGIGESTLIELLKGLSNRLTQ